MNTSSFVLSKRPSIQPLPDEVINQIAAGEVIERPSSVLKELIENSLDAGADQIDVFLKNGGIDEIRLVDNGIGIALDEVTLAVQRHATSKLRTSEDLFSLQSLGFRGEALSSICSVAEVEIRSRASTSPAGYSVVFKAGQQVSPPQLLGAPLGTQITVTNLFGATPARKKFLRSVQTELVHCQNMLKEIALGHPEVRFTLHHQDRLLASYTSTSKKERFLECLKLKHHACEIKEHHEHMHFQAFFALSPTQVARSELYFFINGRPVRNRSFISAIRNVFKELAPQNPEPIGVCFLDIRKDWVDVNVHPQKWEIRCLEQASIYQWLLTILRKHLSSFPAPTPSLASAPPLNLPAKRAPHFGTFSFATSPRPEEEKVPLNWIGRTPQALICAHESGIVIGNIERLSVQIETRRFFAQRNSESFPSAFLNIPCIVRFSQSQAALLEKHKHVLESCGFQIDNFGEGDFSIKKRPAFVSEKAVEKVFTIFLDRLSDLEFVKCTQTNPQTLFSFLVSTQYQVDPETRVFSNSELASELSRCWKERVQSDSVFFELTYQQLQRRENV